MLIGMLHHRKDPMSVTKSYIYATVSKAEGAELIYFTPKSINIEKKTINGFIYMNGNWTKVETSYPDVVYNAGSPIKLKKSQEVIDKLKETVPFTTYSIGNKMNVFNRLRIDGEFSSYLIPSVIINSLRTFLSFVDMYQKIVFKPIYGHKGEGVVLIETVRNNYRILDGTNEVVYDRKQLRNYISEKIKSDKYMVQPYINCKTADKNAYDIRAHIQKDGNGQWVITAIYPRIAPNNSIVSNINRGGYTNYLVPFLKQEFGDEYYNLKRYIEVFSIQLAEKMDKIQKEYFNESIDELGIDIGIDDLKKIWIFEINWRPGSPPAFYLETDVVRNMIKYCIYLAKHKE